MATSNFDLGDDAPIFDTPERVSILAVMGLVFSLLCFIPGAGVIASILGVAGLIGISGSRGRLSGRGMAIAAIVLGLIFSMIWAGVGLGGMKAWGGFKSTVLQPAGAVMSDIEAKNYTAARTKFDPAVATTITDAQFDTFREAYQAEVGAFQSMPSTVAELWTSYATIGQSMQKFQPKPGQPPSLIPLPGIFSTGPALIVQHFDPKASQTSGGPLWSDITIMSTKGTEVQLIGTTATPPRRRPRHHQQWWSPKPRPTRPPNPSPQRPGTDLPAAANIPVKPPRRPGQQTGPFFVGAPPIFG
jgi:hypothetical protein